MVDDEDYDWLAKHTWSVTTGYAKAWVNGKTVRMHRLIMNAKRGEHIDHKDRNPLNNQKSNLRFCTPSENQKNKKPSGKSKYIGVYPHQTKVKKYRKKTNDYVTYISKTRWLATIKINGKYTYLGRFKSEIEAAHSYNNAAKKHHKEFANLNDV